MRTSVAVLLVVLWSPLANSYEIDVHYGLTKWLAMRAGFVEPDAEMIARADQDLDEPTAIEGERRDAIHVVVNEIIFESDPGVRTLASLKVQRDHFSGSVPPPIEPAQRGVKKGKGNDPITDRFRLLLATEVKDKDKWLRSLGQILHTLQDSWSHAGTPDVPISPFWDLRPDHSWGHPRKRGGWSKHRADLTCADPEGAVAMGKESFERLTEFCPKSGASECGKRQWSDIKIRVQDFASRETQNEKKKWFDQEGKTEKPAVGPLAFVDSTSLTKDRYRGMRDEDVVACEKIDVKAYTSSRGEDPLAPFDRGIVASGSPRFLKVATPTACSSSAAVRTFAAQFTDWWTREFPLAPTLEDTKIQADLQRFVDSDEISRQLSRLGAAPIGLDGSRIPAARTWLWTFLTMWLIREHAVVEALGHGDPADRRHKELEDLLKVSHLRHATNAPPDTPLQKASALVPVRIAYTIKDVGADLAGTNQSCALLVRFPDSAPRDVVIIEFRAEVSNMRIVRIGWLSL